MVGGIRVQKPQGYECGEEKGGEEREGEGTKTRDVYVFPWLALTLTVVSDRRTVNEARVGFLSRREDNVFRGEREGGEEGELALLFLAPSSIGLYRFSASDIVYAHDPGTIGRICVPPGARAGPSLPPPPSLGWPPWKKKEEKRSLLENNYSSTFGLSRGRHAAVVVAVAVKYRDPRRRPGSSPPPPPPPARGRFYIRMDPSIDDLSRSRIVYVESEPRG